MTASESGVKVQGVRFDSPAELRSPNIVLQTLTSIRSCFVRCVRGADTAYPSREFGERRSHNVLPITFPHEPRYLTYPHTLGSWL